MYNFVSKEGTWKLDLEGRSDTPALSIEVEEVGTIVRVSRP